MTIDWVAAAVIAVAIVRGVTFINSCCPLLGITGGGHA
jgi:hypothetical protein